MANSARNVPMGRAESSLKLSDESSEMFGKALISNSQLYLLLQLQKKSIHTKRLA